MRLATQLALARSEGDLRGDASEAVRLELQALDATLASRAADSDQPEARLAAALALTSDELAFFWAVVARASDPLLLALLQVLCGTDARRGLSLAHYATIAGLDAERADAITNILSPSHPLLRYQFLLAPDAVAIDVCTPLTTSPRMCAFLRGETEPDEVINAAGGRIWVPHDAQLDEVQQHSRHRIGLGLGWLESVVIVEGPTGAGRRTAVALAAKTFGRDVVSVDLARIAPHYGALESALTALMRECMLTSAIPVIAGVNELTGGESEPAERQRLLARVIESAPGPVALTSNVAGIDLKVHGRRIIRVPWPVPETGARRALWVDALADDLGGLESHVDELALRYRMGAGGIRDGAASARAIRDARGSGAVLTPGISWFDPDSRSVRTSGRSAAA